MSGKKILSKILFIGVLKTEIKVNHLKSTLKDLMANCRVKVEIFKKDK